MTAPAGFTTAPGGGTITLPGGQSVELPRSPFLTELVAVTATIDSAGAGPETILVQWLDGENGTVAEAIMEVTTPLTSSRMMFGKHVDRIVIGSGVTVRAQAMLPLDVAIDSNTRVILTSLNGLIEFSQVKIRTRRYIP